MRAATVDSTVAATRGGERGSRRGNARGIGSAAACRRRASLQRAHARPADDQRATASRCALPASRKVRALLRLSGARPARRRAQPAVRAAVGRPERSARRAALVPEQDPGHRRRARPPARRDAAATPSGSTWRTASSMRSRSPAPPQDGHRDARAERLRALSRAVRRRLPRRAGDRPQPGLQRLAHGAAAPLPRLPRRAARAARHDAFPDDEAFGYLEQWLQLAPFDRRVHETAARRARPARPHPRRRGASGRHRPAVRSRRPRLRAASRCLAGSAGRKPDARAARVRRASAASARCHRASAGAEHRHAPHRAAPRSR